MRILGLLTICLAVIVPFWADPGAAADDISSLIEQGNAAWEKRGTDGNLENRKAADYFLSAVEAAPFSYEAHWKAARSLWWIADQGLLASDDKGRQRDLGRRGMDLAGRALLISPDTTEGHLYWALAALHYCYGIGMVEALKKKIPDEAARHLGACYEKDRVCRGRAGPDGFLGSLPHRPVADQGQGQIGRLRPGGRVGGPRGGSGSGLSGGRAGGGRQPRGVDGADETGIGDGRRRGPRARL